MAIKSIANANTCNQESPVVRLAFTEYITTPQFPLVTDIQDKADWDALITAGTVQLTPLFAAWAVAEAPNTMFGTAGANDTPKGIPFVINDEVPQVISGEFQNLDAATAKSLFEFFQQKDTTGGCVKYGVYLFTRKKEVLTDGATFLPFFVEQMSFDPIAQTDNTTTPTQGKFMLYLSSVTTGSRWQESIVKTVVGFDPLNTTTFNN